MPAQPCSAPLPQGEKCSNQAAVRGLCSGHRAQERKGRPFTALAKPRPRNLRDEELANWFIANYTRAEADCLIWTKAVSNGFANVSANGQKTFAHLFVAEQLVNHAPISLASETVEHTCGRRLCINPEHLLIKARSRPLPRKRSSGEWLEELQAAGFHTSLLPGSFELPATLTAGTELPLHRDCGHTRLIQVRLVNRDSLSSCQDCSRKHPFSEEYWKLRLDSSDLILQGELPSPLTKDSLVNVLKPCGHTSPLRLQTALSSVTVKARCRPCGSDRTKYWLDLAKTNSVVFLDDLPEKLDSDIPVRVLRPCGCPVAVPLSTAVKGHKSFCMKCRSKKGRVRRSKGELQVQAHLEENFNYKIIPSYRELGFEIDLFIPELNLGIEYNGDFWHSDLHLVPKHGITAEQYHTQKLTACRDNGIALAFLWDSDWKRSNSEVVDAFTVFIESQGADTPEILTRLVSKRDVASQ